MSGAQTPLSPVGIAAWQALSSLGGSEQQMRSALSSNKTSLTQRSDLLAAQPVWVGEISAQLQDIPERYATVASRNVAVALTLASALQESLHQYLAGMSPQRIGIIIGTSTSGISSNESAITTYLNTGFLPADFSYVRQEMGATAAVLQDFLGWQGPCHTISTACSSAAKSLAAGQRFIASQQCDAVLVGGIDTLCKLTVCGFHSLDSLASGLCRPFASKRDGICIGEAGALFLLTRQPQQKMLYGCGESSDSWHISAPHPEAKGACTAMRQAFRQAGLRPQDIDYVNLHGTATPQNDAIEFLAMQQLFANMPTFCSSTKHQTGHCLGAAGAIEAAIACAVLDNPEPWLPWQQPDIAPEFSGLHWVGPAAQPQQRIDIIMSNSFAFGGSNASVILGRSNK